MIRHARAHCGQPWGTRRRHARAFLFSLLVLASSSLPADVLIEETHDLVSGWNLIHLPVEPVVKDPHAALSAVNWESLWTWLPSATEPRGGRWLGIHRDAPAFLGTLAGLSGPNSYLLLTRSGGTLRIQGAVRSSRQPLRGGAYQLHGPSFARSSPPTFAAYFSRLGVKERIGSAFELAGQAYRRLAGNDSLRAGAAYWIFPEKDIPAPDHLRLDVGIGGLRFDAQTTVGEMVVDLGDGAGSGAGGQGAAANQQITLRATAIAPSGVPGGADWLAYQKPDGTFAPIGTGVQIDVAPEQTRVRVTLRASTPDTSASASADPQAVVELSTQEGQVVVGAELDVPSLQGTWLGDVSITEVERPTFNGGGFAPAPEMRIALVLDVPVSGPARLLPCVQVSAARDGRKVSYRLEAALFHESISLTGSVAQDGGSGTLTGSTGMAADHPLNPYRHLYHPDHGVGFELSRTVTLGFGDQGPAPGPEDPISQVGILTGSYEEEINGISREPIRIRGTFRLRRFAGESVAPCATPGQ